MRLDNHMRDLRSSPALVDIVFERYLSWRQASAAVSYAYGLWTQIGPGGEAEAFAAYQEALDIEERAAAEYQAAIPAADAA